MTDLLCAATRCRIPGRHRDDCDNADCKGCLKARAADGLRLCPHCTRRIGTDAVETARLWYEIGEILAAAGSTGIPADNPHPGLVISPRAVEVRAEIRHTLVSWVRLIAEDRGMSLPRDESQHSLGAYVARHAQWLAAQEFAGEASDELGTLRTTAWATAYPEGVSIRFIGPCPEMENGALCPGNVRAIMRAADSLLPNKVVCDVDSTHEWPSERWRTLGRSMGRVLEGYLTADVIAEASGRSITAIYRAASECRWRRIPDGRRVRYDVRDVAVSLGWVA